MKFVGVSHAARSCLVHRPFLSCIYVLCSVSTLVVVSAVWYCSFLICLITKKNMGVRRKKLHKSNIKSTRKELRKETRKEKKMRRKEYYTNGKKSGPLVLNPDKDSSNQISILNQEGEKTERKENKRNSDLNNIFNKVLTTEQLRHKEHREQKKIQKQMLKQRNKQLLEANIEEDRNIKQLEKQLKLNKRKFKSIPKKFSEDGLDYLLEICDSKMTKTGITAEQKLNEINDEFEEDFALMTSKSAGNDIYNDIDNDYLEGFLSVCNNDKDEDIDDNDNDSSDKLSNELEMLEDNDNNLFENYEISSLAVETFEINKKDCVKRKKSVKTDVNKVKSNNYCQLNDNISEDLKKKETYDLQKSVFEERPQKAKKRKQSDNMQNNEEKKLYEDCTQYKRNKSSNEKETSEMNYSNNIELNNSYEISEAKGIVKKNSEGTWEDIYGRFRTHDGKIIKNEEYATNIPPAIKTKLSTTIPEDKERFEKLNRLKRQLKGLLNRLTQNNMHNITLQIEELYMTNSRNDMNETLTSLMMASLISHVVTPERLLMEHVVLISILHANVGTEVGAHFLQSIIKKFDEYVDANHDVENKILDNIVNVLSQLYNFKLFDAKLLYDILQKLSNKFGEKNVECILNILRSVGFTLRKDDPLALKNLILDLQNQAANSSERVRDNLRVKFMLDILLAIKNNNVSKIPNYDTSYSEHLKKIMKGFIRKGNYVTQLSISLEDLLKAEERGKWWIVGSAWTGNAPENNGISKNSKKTKGFSEKLLELAKKQRMNTDTRRNIFCVIMSAEDYLDAFERLLKLGLKNQQEREIINMILHCCLQEKIYNPFYAVLAQKFCEFDRKYQMTIKCSIWDKLKSLDDHSSSQISNLAKMLTYLFLENTLPISTLKIVQFSELNKVTLRFMRQILLGILFHKDEDSCLAVFEKVTQSDKLKLFRESLRLFIHHFLLRNLKSESEGTSEHKKSLLETRAKMIEKLLITKEVKSKF